MEKEILRQLIDQNVGVRQIALRLNTSATSVRYWARRHGLEFKNKPFAKQVASDPLCGQCGSTDRTKFYGHKKNICGACHSRYTLELGQEKRDKTINHLGGKCKICGFNKHSSALDIHHTDPSVKDPHFSSMRSWSWRRIEAEILTCVLLCRNCHALVHAGVIDLQAERAF